MKTARLSEVCKLVNGGTPKSGVAEYWGGDVAWLTPAEMGKRTNPYLAQTARTISRIGLANCSARQVPVGAVIMSTRAPIGHLAIPETPMAFNQGCRGLIPDETLDTKYLYYFLWFSRDALNELGTGATFKELSSSALGKYRIPLPPLEEQRRIVAVLDETFAAIAAVTANVEKNLANARELFEAELDALVEDARAAFPGYALADHCRRVTVGHVGPMKDRYQGSGIPFLRSQNVRPFQIELDGVAFIDEAFDSELVKSRLAPGDVAVVRTGYPGTAAVIPPSLPISNCADLVIIRPGPDLNPHYVTAFLNSNLGKRMIAGNLVGAAQKHFNVGAAKRVAIPIPPLGEQERFVARVDQLRALSGQLVTVYEGKIAGLVILKQSLLRRAFAGELATVASPNNHWKTPAFSAQVIALAYRHHLVLGTEATFGRVKAQKALHLCESVGGVDMGRVPIKDAAGPNDFQHMLAAEDWATANQFFEFVPRPSGNGYSFKKLARFNAMTTAGAEALKPVQPQLERAIGLIAPMNSEEAELLATVHAAWNNLLLDGVDATEAAIIHEARENWHVAKQKFGDGKFRRAIATIRKKGIVPDGSAKRVGGQEAMLF